MKLVKKQSLLFGISLVISGSLLMTQDAVSQAPTLLSEMETSLDLPNDSEDGDFPVVGYLFESVNPVNQNRFELDQIAFDSCQATTFGVRDNTPVSASDYKARACVQNDEVLYKLGKVRIHGCEWIDREDKSLNRSSKNFFGQAVTGIFDSLRTEIVIENIKVYFHEDELRCDGEIVLENGERFPVSGDCAVATGMQFAKVDGKSPRQGDDPLYISFDFAENDELLKTKLAPLKLLSPDHSLPPSNLYLTVSVPITRAASDYLSYMLSNEAMEACDNKLK
jgi:hypothetical protein